MVKARRRAGAVEQGPAGPTSDPASDPASSDDERAHLRAAVAAADEAVLALDPDGGLRQWNLAARRILGAAVLLEPGADVALAFTQPDEVRRLLGRCAAGEPVRGERVVVTTPDGRGGPAVLTLVPLARGGVVRALTAVLRDVSEETLAQERLAHAEERILRAETLAHSGTFLIDATDRTAQWSLGMHLVYGLTPGEVAPSLAAHADLLPEPQRDRLARMVSEALYGRVPPSLEHERTQPDGTEVWIHLAVAPLFGVDGRIVGVSGLCQDVSDRVRAEQALQEALALERAAADELRQVDSMRKEFLATVAHELRGPVATVLGLVPFLRKRAPEQAELIDPIERKARQMGRLVETLLDDARLAAGRVELRVTRFAVRPAAGEVLHERVGGAEGAAWSLACPADLEIDMDREAFTLTLGNLVGNAVKYAGDGLVEVSAHREAQEVVVSVADHGPGIPLELQEHLFEAFYRVPGSEQVARGSGFGLSIARRYVELHGGTISVDSAPGRGARFTFRVPLGVPGTLGR